MIQPHRGAFVVGLDENSTRDHYELLGRVYGYGALRAAERASAEQIAALGVIGRKLQAATDPHEFSPADGARGDRERRRRRRRLRVRTQTTQIAPSADLAHGVQLASARR